MLWKGKSLGGKRCVRHDLSTNLLYENKLKTLAVSCDLPYLTLGSLIVCFLLDNPSFVHTVQRHYNTVEHYWIDIEFDQHKKAVYKLKTTSTIHGLISLPRSRYLSFPRDRRLKFSYSNEHDLKLGLLARSCNLRKSEIAALALHYALDSSQLVMHFQERYNIHRHYWVTPLEENGIVTYMLSP
jgi:hypothetical protein